MDAARGKTLDVGAVGLKQSQIPSHAAGAFDPRVLFPSASNPLEIEIGSGKGTFLVQQAARQPGTNFLGIEWTAEFWRYAADRVRRRELANVRLLQIDASEFFRFWLPSGIASVIHLYFSDPWPKTRHHKRRVIQDETLAHFHRVLSSAGELRIVTDHVELWAWCEDHAARNAHLFSVTPFVAPDSAGVGEVVGTNFERKFAREGRPFMAMTLVKQGQSAAREPVQSCGQSAGRSTGRSAPAPRGPSSP
ncbi:MAG: tRNA (guanosine(46)-N7)-methyltransferase TrmB [Phycisphaerales bacterium]|nr:tRNA (guanosine(46)-N7)-methyltransferase TrmB [Phycisphaerales bacterium]